MKQQKTTPKKSTTEKKSPAKKKTERKNPLKGRLIYAKYTSGHITGPERENNVEGDIYDIKVLLRLYTHHYDILSTPPTGYSKQKLKSAFNDLLSRYGLSEKEYFKNIMADFDKTVPEYIEKAVYAAIKEIENPGKREGKKKCSTRY